MAYEDDNWGKANFIFDPQNSSDPVPDPDPAEKTALNAKLTEAKAIAQGNYTDESWQALQAAIAAAQAIADNASADQEQVDAQATALQAAIDGLKEKSTDPSTAPKEYIFGSKYEATFLNWILFFLGFGFIWMWF